MLESEIKKLTVAVEALTAAMGNSPTSPLVSVASALETVADAIPDAEHKATETKPSGIPLAKRQKEMGARAFVLIKDSTEARRKIIDKLGEMGARKITTLDGDQLDEIDAFLVGLKG